MYTYIGGLYEMHCYVAESISKPSPSSATPAAHPCHGAIAFSPQLQFAMLPLPLINGLT